METKKSKRDASKKIPKNQTAALKKLSSEKRFNLGIELSELVMEFYRAGKQAE